MFITRPLFVLIGHVWHIAVPLATLTLDRELRTQWPAHLLLPARLRGAHWGGILSGTVTE